MESNAHQRKGGLFPSASAVKTKKGPINQDGEGMSWLSNQSFDPHIAQARTHHHEVTDIQTFDKETIAASANVSYQKLTDKVSQVSVNAESSNYASIPSDIVVKREKAESDSPSLAPITSDAPFEINQDESSDAVHRDWSDSESSSSNIDEFGRGDHKHGVSRVKIEGAITKQESLERHKKHRTREESHRHKKSRKRHHRSVSSPDEMERKKYRKKKKKHKDDREKKKHKDVRDKKKDRVDREKTPVDYKSSKESKSYKACLSSMWIDDIGFLPETPFVVDEKCDKDNLCFKTLHYTDLAFYRRHGTSCLGLDTERQMVDWGNKKGREKSKKHSGNDSRYFEKVCADDDVERVLPTDKKKQHENIDHVFQKDSLEMPYIPVKPSLDIPMSDPSIPEKVPDDSSQSGEGGLSEVVASYNKHLQEHPGDVPKWLEFLRFQDQLFQTVNSQVVEDSQGTTIKKSKREQLILDKKLAILEKALKVNPMNPDLQLEQMELCRETWEMGKLSRQWDSVIRHHSENISMWKQYLSFKRSSFAKFSVSDIASTYSKYLNAMEAQDTTVKLDIVMDMCHFWRQSGHTEKAVSLLQALVEFNCFCPKQVKESATLEGKIAFFEPFLDSNEPRFGQPGAKGWSKWVEKKERGGWSSQPPVSKIDDEDDSVIKKTHLEWQAWLQEEVHRERANFLPWQPGAGQTEDDCEDPERMVLVDDITPFIIKLDSVDLKFKLILQFLDFLGVGKKEPLSCLHGSGLGTLEHPSEIFGCRSSSFRGSPVGGVRLSGERIPDLVHLGNNGTEAGELCGDHEQNKSLLHFADNIISQAIPLFPPEAKKHLTLMQMQYNLPRVDLSMIPKRQKKQQKEGQRYAKKLLSQECNRNNLALWEEYAKWEWSNGNKDESQRIFETALAFSNLNLAAEEDDQEGITRLLSTYATLKLFICYSSSTHETNSCQNNTSATNMPCIKQEVLHSLTTLGEGGKFVPLSSIQDRHVSAGRILKARKGYVELYSRATASSKDSIHSGTCHVRMFTCLDQQGSQLVHIALCYALFQYLSVGMQAAGVVFEETLTHWDGLLQHVNSTLDDAQKEVVHQQLEVDAELTMLLYTHVVSHHVRSHPMPVTSLRNLMQRALRRYGNNPELLRGLIALEARSHIAGRLRRYFDKAVSEAQSPIPLLYAIHAELHRLHRVDGDIPGKETGITHRLRSLFDRASSNKYTRHCVLLWRLYLLFEVQNGDPKRGEAIFYRALQHCPWAKILYLDAVRYFPEELQEVLDLLMEKELRVRAPIEEVQLLMKVAQNKRE